MKRAKKLIIANWKMNPRTLDDARELFSKTKRVAQTLRRVKTVVCPPFVFIGTLVGRVSSTKCVLGAQDVFWENPSVGGGAYTGEISAHQLAALDTNYVIIGHSERRALGETDEIVNKKTRAALAQNLSIILCIGESERDEDGEYLHFVREEIRASLVKVSKKDLVKLTVAYEPIWAVGAGAKRADTPEELLEMAIFIRKTLSDLFGKKEAHAVPILYGGSVGEKNTGAFLRGGGVQGLLVGRASLNAKTFSAILKIAENVRN